MRFKVFCRTVKINTNFDSDNIDIPDSERISSSEWS